MRFSELLASAFAEASEAGIEPPYTGRSLEEKQEICRKLELTLYTGGLSELLLDCDEGFNPIKFWQAMQILNLPEDAVTWTLSKSKRNKHLRIQLNGNTAPIDILAMQAMLGSDPVKEALTLQHLRDTGEFLNVLFEVPGHNYRPFTKETK